MGAEDTSRNSEPRVTVTVATPDENHDRGEPRPSGASSADDLGGGSERGRVVEKRQLAARGDTTNATDAPRGKRESPAKAVSKAKLELQSRLPALEDDRDIGVHQEHTVTRDGKADLRFIGVLLASVAPGTAPEGRWQELRVYETDGGKHVFSRTTRNVLEKERDTHEADVYDPAPTSVPSQLMRSARDMTRQRPFTWMDAAVAFFGYDPLAKDLYRKLSVDFEERIT
jgi:hypothetical protein